MKVSTKGRYALRIMLDLALNCGDTVYLPLCDIADRQGVSQKYAEQIIMLLMRNNMIKSQRGKCGGYMLSKKPNEYTVGDILRASEGSLAPISCVEDSPNRCEKSCHCPTLFFWEGLNKVINEYIDGTTLEDIANEEKKFSNK